MVDFGLDCRLCALGQHRESPLQVEGGPLSARVVGVAQQASGGEAALQCLGHLGVEAVKSSGAASTGDPQHRRRGLRAALRLCSADPMVCRVRL